MGDDITNDMGRALGWIVFAIMLATALNVVACVRASRADPVIVAMIDQAAHAEGVPVHIARAVVRHESGLRPYLRGAAGEWGLGQIKCQTARGVGFDGPCAALMSPTINLKFSMRYLAAALRRGGAGCAGVSLYQSGIGARPRCSSYGREIMGNIE